MCFEITLKVSIRMHLTLSKVILPQYTHHPHIRTHHPRSGPGGKSTPEPGGGGGQTAAIFDRLGAEGEMDGGTGAAADLMQATSALVTCAILCCEMHYQQSSWHNRSLVWVSMGERRRLGSFIL